MGPELLEKLTEEWQAIAKVQTQTADFLHTSVKKAVAAGGFNFSLVSFFNQKLDINRFFLEDSDGNQKNNDGADAGDLDFNAKQGTGQMGFADNSDPFENELEEALCVFKSGDGNTDILEKNENLIMFYVDLENESIISKAKGGEENKHEDQDEELNQSKHPVLFNQYPCSANHSLLLLFADAGLPQVLSDEIIVLVLQVFKLSDEAGLRLGYNSMGADCIANNLHFHLVYAD